MTAPLERLRAFLFPGGEDRARAIRAIRNTQKGHIRSAPDAPWIALDAEERIDATRTGFRWEARYKGGRMGFITIVDAYEGGHGKAALKLGGVVPLKTMSGPGIDRGEVQRYLANTGGCPPMLLNNPGLEIAIIDDRTLRLRDRDDPTGATVDLEVGDDGCPGAARALRPRTEGKQTIETPWYGLATNFQEWEGMRIARTIEAVWEYPEGPFSYFRADLIPIEAVR
jgi:hypothetical protein